MIRVVAIAACGLSLVACSGMPSFMQFDMPKAPVGLTTVQFESEPPGAEARVANGQSCRTPCSMSVTANDFTVSFALAGYQPQTVPVRIVVPSEAPDRGAMDAGSGNAPRLVPNPVYVELQAVPPPAPPKKKPAPKKPAAPKPVPTAMAPPPPAPAPAPASPWPPPPMPGR